MAETFPVFGPLMDLLGGTLVSTTSFIFPVLFFFYLNAIEKKMNEEKSDNKEKVSFGQWVLFSFLKFLIEIIFPSFFDLRNPLKWC